MAIAFIKSVRDQVTEGTAALFLMSSDAIVDRVAEVFRGDGIHLIKSNLTGEQEATLDELFAA